MRITKIFLATFQKYAIFFKSECASLQTYRNFDCVNGQMTLKFPTETHKIFTKNKRQQKKLQINVIQCDAPYIDII